MAFAVVVDVPPVQAEAAERALATCNAALGSGACALANEGTSGRWYAVVRFDRERQAVITIELYDGDSAGPRVASSELEFKDRDTELERWASAGVVVAALVAAQTATPPKPEPVPDPPPVVLTRPIVAAPSLQRPPRGAPAWLRLDLGATGGSELANDDLRFGPLARVGLALTNVPLFAFASGAYTVRGSGTPDLTWITGSLGFGARVGFAQQRLALEVRTEAVAESVLIHASDGSHAESARRTRFGPRFGLDLSGYFAKNLSLVVGLEAATLRPRVDITVAGESQSGLPPFNWGFISAVRYDFR